MNKEIIELTKEKIKELQDSQSKFESKICTYNNEITAIEKELFKVKNAKASLEGALEKLEDAEVKERGGE